MGSKREQSNITIAILGNLTFWFGAKSISYLWGTNNIFVDCIIRVGILFSIYDCIRFFTIFSQKIQILKESNKSSR